MAEERLYYLHRLISWPFLAIIIMNQMALPWKRITTGYYDTFIIPQ